MDWKKEVDLYNGKIRPLTVKKRRLMKANPCGIDTVRYGIKVSLALAVLPLWFGHSIVCCTNYWVI